jgi:hypothetical protein
MISAPNLERVLLGRRGMALALLWGFAEGTLFFIVPDVLLTLTALFSIRRSVAQMFVVTAGALVAGGIMFTWSAQSPAAKDSVARVPFVGAAMLDRVDRSYADSGALALLKGPLSGIPYKAFAVEAPGRVAQSVFLLWSVPARLERFIITWAMFAALGLLLRRGKKNFALPALVIHGAYWCVVYGIYWTVI